MSFIHMVRSDYAEYIALHASEYPEGLIAGLKAKERVPQLIDNLARELITAESKGVISLDRVKIKGLVYEMTKMFLNLLKTQAEQNSLSISEKLRMVSEAESKRSINDETAAEYTRSLEKDKIIQVTESRDEKLDF